ncbi:hypothetical protein OD098_003493 [Salmonella enterica]|nr:hypothetical protein [Salmonella enterica]EJX3319275.1 hypothetical protein [Salmonella enterica]ELG7087717.1 hypothetical protein [Salmonella enterica]ELL0619338.1 hypothetical protein [Salmonella enterica]ELL0633030.1 hypothetical protein [Salmonella enterica]
MPLPLREYYPIERASELLECTVDDLLHWGGSGNIRLCLMLHNVNAICFFDFSIFEEIIKDFKIPRVENNDKINRFIELYYVVYEFYKKNELNFINELKCKTYGDVAIMFLTGVERQGIRVSNISDIKNKKYDFEFMPNYISNFIDGEDAECYHLIKAPVKLNGFFPLRRRFYEYEKLGVISCVGKTKYVAISSLDFSLDLEVVDNLEFYINDLFILKDDFIKIVNTSKKGGELTKMPGYEHFVIYDEKNKNKNKNKSLTDARNSATARLIAKALIIKYLPKVKDNPAKLAAVLEGEIKEAGLGAVSVSKDTVSRWMKED